MATREHTADPTKIHYEWDVDLEPVLTIGSGDIVHFDLHAAGEGQVWPGASFDEDKLDFDSIYNLCGPVNVAGAAPGDMLEVEILDLQAGLSTRKARCGKFPEEISDAGAPEGNSCTAGPDEGEARRGGADA